jgi:SAM-dependent methyltransferase
MIVSGKQADVRSMYEMHPFPSSAVDDGLIEDVANNLGILYPEHTLSGKRILDAGCGSGHRLVAAAKRYPDAAFVGVDMTSAALATAKRLADAHRVHNVKLVQADLLDLRLRERFDVIISAGVIHHLEEPSRGLANLAALLTDGGLLVIWLYHALGEHRRLCDRELLLTLWGAGDPGEGLELLNALGMTVDPKHYGSTAVQTARSDVSRVNVDVDAYMHPLVRAYRIEEALRMLSPLVAWTAVSGINGADTSKLIDLSETDRSASSFFNVQVDELFEDEMLRSRYRRLDRLSKLRVIELMLRPTGFTILGGLGSPSALGSRIEGNVIPFPPE